MLSSEQEAERLMQEGANALREGRAAEARLCFEKVTASGSMDETAWLLLAAARGADGDREGEETAVNRLLDIDPKSVRGQVMKGDCRARAGDEDLACHFYRSALQLAEDRRLPDETVAEVERAERALATLLERAHANREARLRARGLPPQSWSPRFRHSLELAAGRRKLYLQEPTAYNYPGLPHIQFYDASQFSWAPALEAATASVREELMQLFDDGLKEFRPYIQTHLSTAPIETNKALINSKDWSILALCENGWVAPDLIRRCPRTWEAVLNTPLMRIPGAGPVVVFSMLRAGAHIARHSGMYNMRLTCHLPLIVPPGCRFRVGDEVRDWEVGKLMIFDDSIDHEAWNDGTEDRVVLIFDIWRPELTDQEKHELTALFSD
jgi:aspartyl/asparaginyl beta-hydroxylase (cupin superfamily)/Tfp pilus assembly protein PilF